MFTKFPTVETIEQVKTAYIPEYSIDSAFAHVNCLLENEEDDDIPLDVEQTLAEIQAECLDMQQNQENLGDRVSVVQKVEDGVENTIIINFLTEELIKFRDSEIVEHVDFKTSDHLFINDYHICVSDLDSLTEKIDAGIFKISNASNLAETSSERRNKETVRLVREFIDIFEEQMQKLEDKCTSEYEAYIEICFVITQLIQTFKKDTFVHDAKLFLELFSTSKIVKEVTSVLLDIHSEYDDI